MLPGADGLTSVEGQAGNLARCSELAQSQASLLSASSVGSARGDEGTGYADVYGDYRPLFDNLQDPDNVSLQGGSCWGGRGGSRREARSWLLTPASPHRGRNGGPGSGRPG